MHDLGLLSTDPEANFACFYFWFGHGMMQLWFIFFEQVDVVGEIQVARTIEFGPVDAGPNTWSSSLHDIVKGDEEEEGGQDASLPDPSRNLEEVCVAILCLNAAARA